MNWAKTLKKKARNRSSLLIATKIRSFSLINVLSNCKTLFRIKKMYHVNKMNSIVGAFSTEKVCLLCVNCSIKRI